MGTPSTLSSVGWSRKLLATGLAGPLRPSWSTILLRHARRSSPDRRSRTRKEPATRLKGETHRWENSNDEGAFMEACEEIRKSNGGGELSRFPATCSREAGRSCWSAIAFGLRPRQRPTRWPCSSPRASLSPSSRGLEPAHPGGNGAEHLISAPKASPRDVRYYGSGCAMRPNAESVILYRRPWRPTGPEHYR